MCLTSDEEEKLAKELISIKQESIKNLSAHGRRGSVEDQK